MNTLVQAIQQRYQGDFMTVGITGSVAVGKVRLRPIWLRH